MKNLSKGALVYVTTTNGGRVIARLGADYRPTYSIELDRRAGSFSIPGWRIASVQLVEERGIDDADVMLTAELLQTCGMSPIDRELWAQDHGRHYAAGSKRRLLADARS